MSQLRDIFKANDDIISCYSKAPKRAKTEENKISDFPMFESIANTILQIHDTISKDKRLKSNPSSIEIEVRVGMVVQGFRRLMAKVPNKRVLLMDNNKKNEFNIKYKSGVDHIFASMIKKKLHKNPDFEATVQPKRVFRGDSQGNRWQIDEKSKKILHFERKDHFIRSDVALLSYDYDVRIDAATEIEMDSQYRNVTNLHWEQERHKSRTSYISSSAHKIWRIDLTEVETITNDGNSSPRKKEFEFEFELEDSIKSKFLLEDKIEKRNELAKYITHHLLLLVDYFLPFEDIQEVEASLSLVRDPEVDKNINFSNSIINPGGTNLNRSLQRADSRSMKAQFDFLGSMPVNLTRQNFVGVQSSDYFITEKSDGVRYLLYTVNDINNTPMALLVNRSKEVFEFRGNCEIGQALGHGVILDGELVYNRTYKEAIFLVFDVLLWEEKSCISLKFQDRLDIIQSKVFQKYSKNYDSIIMKRSLSSPKAPIKLIRKNFVQKKDFIALHDKIRIVEGERVFFDGEKRHHKTDGFIFQPNTSYVFSKNYDLLKWKWPDLRSIDLQLSIENDSRSPLVYLMCSGPNGVLLNCSKRGDTNVGLGPFDTLRLLADIDYRGFSPSQPIIVEVTYDPSIGLWAYNQIRKDKNQPNYIDSVLGVFMEQAEAISIEELEYSINASAFSLNSDFESQILKMKKKLIEWQRIEVKKLRDDR